jgi:hypothetical protein
MFRLEEAAAYLKKAPKAFEKIIDFLPRLREGLRRRASAWSTYLLVDHPCPSDVSRPGAVRVARGYLSDVEIPFGNLDLTLFSYPGPFACSQRLRCIIVSAFIWVGTALGARPVVLSNTRLLLAPDAPP